MRPQPKRQQEIIPTPAPTQTQTEKACVRLRLAPLRPAIHTVLTGLQEHGGGRPQESRLRSRSPRLWPLSLTLKIGSAGLALLSWRLRRLNILPSPVSVLKT